MFLIIFNFLFLSLICCNSAFEQGNFIILFMRYINAFIIVIITRSQHTPATPNNQKYYVIL